MATIIQTLEGRLLTIFNRTSNSIGLCGIVVKPGQTRQFKLSKVQESDKYMSDLETAWANGTISLAVDDVPIQEVDAGQLDAPLPGDVEITREVFNDLVAADPNGIKESFTAPAADTTYSGSDLDGTTGPGEMLPPRNVSITGTTGIGEALDGGDALVIGEDIDGQLRTETITLEAVGPSATDTELGATAFKRIVSVMIPGDASGSPGDYEIGFGDKIGLKRPLEVGGLLDEKEDNATPGTAGIIVLSGTSAPNGLYTPNNLPDGSRDYIIAYVPG
jgi:hypothetical protein